MFDLEPTYKRVCDVREGLTSVLLVSSVTSSRPNRYVVEIITSPRFRFLETYIQKIFELMLSFTTNPRYSEEGQSVPFRVESTYRVSSCDTICTVLLTLPQGSTSVVVRWSPRYTTHKTSRLFVLFLFFSFLYSSLSTLY